MMKPLLCDGLVKLCLTVWQTLISLLAFVLCLAIQLNFPYLSILPYNTLFTHALTHCTWRIWIISQKICLFTEYIMNMTNSTGTVRQFPNCQITSSWVQFCPLCLCWFYNQSLIVHCYKVCLYELSQCSKCFVSSSSDNMADFSKL